MQTLSTEQLVGQTIDNYVVRSLLGRSRLNAVYLAQNPMQQDVVTFTTFRLPEHFSSEAHTRFLQRFAHEAAAVMSLKHPNLLPILGYGEKFGYSYLITPSMTNESLANLLQRQRYYAPGHVLSILEHVAAGVGYAHHKGIVHGALKLSNILFQRNETFIVAGFGLSNILQQRGIKQFDKPYGHLLNIADTFLYAPTTIAPEVVQGQPVDQRSDIYGIGALLFELLSGKPLFTGSSPLDTAMQHVQHPLPSLRQIRPDIPIALERVVNHALARNPDQRFQHVGEFVEAFAQTYRGERSQTTSHYTKSTSSPLITSDRPGVNESVSGTREETISTGPWQLLPPVVTGKMNAVSITGKQMNMASMEPKPRVQQDSPYLAKQSEQSQNASSTQAFYEGQSGMHSPSLSSKRSRRSTKRSSTTGRRRVVALLAAGSVAAVGVGVAAKMNILHLIPSTTSSLSPVVSKTTTNGNGSQMKGTGHGSQIGNMGHGATPTHTTPQGHSGTVVGKTDLASNASMGFLNPGDGMPSLLIHLPNGKFVAYERACTHQGVSVYYDPVTHEIVCPAHGSIFDPANNAAVIQGPAAMPLALVTVRVNADGTITA